MLTEKVIKNTSESVICLCGFVELARLFILDKGSRQCVGPEGEG